MSLVHHKVIKSSLSSYSLLCCAKGGTSGFIPIRQELPDFGPNWFRLAPNWTNLGLFKISLSTIWLGEAKCTKSDLKKIPGFVPFCGNLTHIWSKSDAPDSSSHLVITVQGW